MKIIFLDIDGVFNSEKYYRQRKDFTPWDEAKEFDPVCVNLFNNIIGNTGAKIVISSCWRNGNLNYLQTLFNMVGIYGDVIGETPRLRFDIKASIPRGLEIQEYIETQYVYDYKLGHRFLLKSYVIMDDSSDMLYCQKDNFVNTNNLVGLTKEDCDTAIRILNNETDN